MSATALSRARARLGSRADQVNWIVADVTGDWQVPRVDVWHDRAVFHFLTVAAQRDAYVAHLHRSLKSGGTAIIATFAPDGPAKCSGLPVARYSAEGIATRLGPDFALAEAVTEGHQTPTGGRQSFSYGRFIRR